MESSYKRQGDLQYDNSMKRKRSYYWETAIGLNKVDGLSLTCCKYLSTTLKRMLNTNYY